MRLPGGRVRGPDTFHIRTDADRDHRERLMKSGARWSGGYRNINVHHIPHSLQERNSACIDVHKGMNKTLEADKSHRAKVRDPGRMCNTLTDEDQPGSRVPVAERSTVILIA